MGGMHEYKVKFRKSATLQATVCHEGFHNHSMQCMMTGSDCVNHIPGQSGNEVLYETHQTSVACTCMIEIHAATQFSLATPVPSVVQSGDI